MTLPGRSDSDDRFMLLLTHAQRETLATLAGQDVVRVVQRGLDPTAYVHELGGKLLYTIYADGALGDDDGAS